MKDDGRLMSDRGRKHFRSSEGLDMLAVRRRRVEVGMSGLQVC